MDMNGNEAPNWVTLRQIDPKRVLPRAAALFVLTLALAMHAGLAGAETAAAPAGDAPSSAAETQAAAPDTDHPVDPHQAAREARARELIARAAAAEPTITALLEQIAEDVGGQLVDPDAKLSSEETVATEIELNEKRDTVRKIAKTEVGDVLHYTLIINDSPAGAYVAGARKVYPELTRHGYRVEHVYNFWPRGDSFAGITSTLKTRDGLIWKLSIHTPRSYRAVNETRSQIENMRNPDTKPEERAGMFEALVDVWDIVPVPKGALAQGAIYPRDRLVVLDEFDQIGSADREAKLDAWAMRWRNGL